MSNTVKRTISGYVILACKYVPRANEYAILGTRETSTGRDFVVAWIDREDATTWGSGHYTGNLVSAALDFQARVGA